MRGNEDFLTGLMQCALKLDLKFWAKRGRERKKREREREREREMEKVIF